MRSPGDGDDRVTSTDRAGLFAGSVVVVILLVTFASGPVLAGVSFTAERVTAEDATPGNATVSNVSFPGTVTLTHESGGQYAYDAPPVRVSFERITGGDVQVTYLLTVPELGVSTGRTTVFDGSDGTELRIQLQQSAEGDPPNSTQYDGTVYLSLISEGDQRLVARSPVTVRVVVDG